MRVVITTSSKYRDMVIEILADAEFLSSSERVQKVGLREIVIEHDEDFYYRPLAAWAGDALACGLIHGFKREA